MEAELLRLSIRNLSVVNFRDTLEVYIGLRHPFAPPVLMILPAPFLSTRSHVAHFVLAPNTADDCLDLLNLLSFYLWSAKITGTNPQVSFCKLSFVYDRQHSTN